MLLWLHCFRLLSFAFVALSRAWLHCFRLLRFAFVALSRACFMGFCLVSDFCFGFGFGLGFDMISGSIGAATAALPSPSLTHYRKPHRHQRLRRAFVIFGSSFSFGKTGSQL